MNLSDLNKWFYELTPEQQKELRASHPPLDKLPQSLIPAEHGATIEAQIEYGKKRFFELADKKEPFYLARIGDCEIAAMGCGYYAHTPHPLAHAKDQLHWSCGFERDFLIHRKELIESFKNAQLLGMQQNWLPWRMNTIAIFHMLGLPVPHPNAVEVHLPYKMLIDGSLFSYLKGKDVLLIGGLAGELASAWRRPEFLNFHRRFGPLDQLKSLNAVKTLKRGEQGGAWRSLDRVTDMIKGATFDVALISAAVPAKILAYRIWKMGKVALDVGFVFDALLGNGERKLRPCLRDVPWPDNRGW
ncbi:MAG TPA: hypothetical protein VFS19_01695 [Planctomycetota bacterium]|nr:hypothetical protein [Planctomycetota bacterium]